MKSSNLVSLEVLMYAEFAELRKNIVFVLSSLNFFLLKLLLLILLRHYFKLLCNF